MLPIVSSPVKSNFNTFYYYKQAFTDSMIEHLENLVNNNYQFQKGQVGHVELGLVDTSIYNNRDIAYLWQDEQTQWLFDILIPLVHQANDAMYQFDLSYVTDPIHYVIYPEDGGHLDWHLDIGAGEVNRRKLSLTVQLSDPSEYEGGEFEIWYGHSDEFVELPRKKGDVIIFPSFLMHRVKPITRGQRKALVFWTGGEPFK